MTDTIEKKQLSKKSIIMIIIGAILAVAITVICCIAFYRVPIVYDIKGIVPIENNVLKLSKDDKKNPSSFVSLVKMKNGEPSNEDFRVILFTDLHICELRERSTKTVDYMVKAIQKEKPDLVLIAGDTMNGLNNHKRVKQFGAIMEKLGVYWAPVLGNHEGDRKLLMNREKNVKVWSEFEYCLMESDTKLTQNGETVWGHGNYAFNILSSDYKIVQSFIMLDSGNKVSADDSQKLSISPKSSDFIKETQIQWYKETITKINAENGQPVESMLCVHIPLPEYSYAINFDEDNLKIGSINEGWELVYGKAIEKVSCSEYNSGMYKALVEYGTRAVLCGHDHLNDFTVYNSEDNIYLVYLRNSTYSSYDIITKGISDNINDQLQGYNILTLKMDGRFSLTSYTNITKLTETIIAMEM